MMSKISKVYAGWLLLALLFLAVPSFGQEMASASVSGIKEVPAVITSGRGFFVAEINSNLTRIDYTLDVSRLKGDFLQAHLHLGQAGVNGAIILFVCTNLGNGPQGTPPCPSGGGEVSGTWTIDDVIPAPNQGIRNNGQALARTVLAMRKGVAYVNVHTTDFPAGEIRGQIKKTTQLEEDL